MTQRPKENHFSLIFTPSLKCSHPLEDPTVTDIFHSVTNYSVGKMADSLTAALLSSV